MKIITIVGSILILLCILLIAGHMYYMRVLTRYTATAPIEIVHVPPSRQVVEETENQITEITHGLDNGEEQTFTISAAQIQAAIDLIPQLKKLKKQCDITIEDGFFIITASVPIPIGETQRYLNGKFKVLAKMSAPGKLDAKIISGTSEEGGSLPSHLLLLANSLIIPQIMGEPKVREYIDVVKALEVKGDRLTVTLMPPKSGS